MAACEVSDRSFNFAVNESYKSDIAEGPNLDPLFLPTNIRSFEQPHDIGVTFVEDSRDANVDVVVNMEPNSDYNNIITATKYVSRHNLTATKCRSRKKVIKQIQLFCSRENSEKNVRKVAARKTLIINHN